MREWLPFVALIASHFFAFLCGTVWMYFNYLDMHRHGVNPFEESDDA